MQNLAGRQTSELRAARTTYVDPILNMDDVKWAARRFILIYGDDAPVKAKEYVNRLDARGKLRTAEMFARVQRECARLLKKSESFRNFSIN
jgi:hypothetical protein